MKEVLMSLKHKQIFIKKILIHVIVKYVSKLPQAMSAMLQ